MTMPTYPVPFHTPNLVWDSPIAIYLFLLGISSGAVQLAIAYKRSHKLENPSQNWIIRAAAVLGSVPTLIGLTILVFHLARPWTFWKLMFNYQFNSVMSMGVMLFQVYMLFLVVWCAVIFKEDIARLLNRFLPKLSFLVKWITACERVMGATEVILFILAAVLGAYTGFLLSALISYLKGDSHESHFIHKFEVPIMVTELGLIVCFFVGLYFGGGQKVVALENAFSGFWGAVFWIGVMLIGIIIPLLANLAAKAELKYNRNFIIIVSICDLIGVLCLRYYILYAGQLTVA